MTASEAVNASFAAARMPPPFHGEQKPRGPMRPVRSGSITWEETQRILEEREAKPKEKAKG